MVLLGRTVRYTVAAQIDTQARRIHLALDPDEPHDVAVLETTWRVHPHADGGSIVELHVVTSSGLPVPHFLERRITEGTTRNSVADLVRALDRVAAAAAVSQEG